jgi:hypothetical protein
MDNYRESKLLTRSNALGVTPIGRKSPQISNLIFGQ